VSARKPCESSASRSGEAGKVEWETTLTVSDPDMYGLDVRGVTLSMSGEGSVFFTGDRDTGLVYKRRAGFGGGADELLRHDRRRPQPRRQPAGLSALATSV
jgi:hypothetical protein